MASRLIQCEKAQSPGPEPIKCRKARDHCGKLNSVLRCGEFKQGSGRTKKRSRLGILLLQLHSNAISPRGVSNRLFFSISIILPQTHLFPHWSRGSGCEALTRPRCIRGLGTPRSIITLIFPHRRPLSPPALHRPRYFFLSGLIPFILSTKEE